jgi:hypothetical protein
MAEMPTSEFDRNDDTEITSGVPEPIKIGQFRVAGRCLAASLKIVLYGRTEDLILFVQPFGDEIGVEVQPAVLDFGTLPIVAERVAEKLNTPAGRATLAMAAKGEPTKRGRGPLVRVKLVKSAHDLGL